MGIVFHIRTDRHKKKCSELHALRFQLLSGSCLSGFGPLASKIPKRTTPMPMLPPSAPSVGQPRRNLQNALEAPAKPSWSRISQTLTTLRQLKTLQEPQKCKKQPLLLKLPIVPLKTDERYASVNYHRPADIITVRPQPT